MKVLKEVEWFSGSEKEKKELLDKRLKENKLSRLYNHYLSEEEVDLEIAKRKKNEQKE